LQDFEALTVVTLKITVSWGVMPYRLLEIKRHYTRTEYFHLLAVQAVHSSEIARLHGVMSHRNSVQSVADATPYL
jgi:hypothetical protein